MSLKIIQFIAGVVIMQLIGSASLFLTVMTSVDIYLTVPIINVVLIFYFWQKEKMKTMAYGLIVGLFLVTFGIWQIQSGAKFP